TFHYCVNNVYTVMEGFESACLVTLMQSKSANVRWRTAHIGKYAQPAWSVRIVIFPHCAAFAWLQYILQPCWSNNFLACLSQNHSHVIYSMKDTEDQRRPLGGNRMTFAYHPATHPGRKHAHDYTQ